MKQKKSLQTILSISKVSLCLMVSVLMYACAPGIKVATDYDSAIDFSNYRTFDLYHQTSVGLLSSLNSDRILRSIQGEMEKKGFLKSAIKPDLIVHAVTIVKNKRSFSVNSNAAGYARFYGPRGYWGAPVNGNATVRSDDYKEGTLVIDVIDRKTNKLIWTGTVSSEIHKQPKHPDKAIASAIAKVLTAFPICAVKSESKNFTGQ
jgi:hypothetical protein